MAFPREILNELKWREDMDLSSARITYEHRGAPGDEITISGDDIIDLGKSFFTTSTSQIPYHRIISIVYEGRRIFDIREFAHSRE